MTAPLVQTRLARRQPTTPANYARKHRQQRPAISFGRRILCMVACALLSGINGAPAEAEPGAKEQMQRLDEQVQ